MSYYIVDVVKPHVPKPIWSKMSKCYTFCRKIRKWLLGWEDNYAETSKAKARREREGFFEKYCQGRGLDIGHGGDMLLPDIEGWDFEDGDAQYMKGATDESYDFVYASHILEHMVDPGLALQNWWRLVKPGGFLIFAIPHRDLYEKKKALPSRFNKDHKTFFLLDEDEEPDTVGILGLIERSLDSYEIEYAKVCDEGYKANGPEEQSEGEFSIEVVLHKQK